MLDMCVNHQSHGASPHRGGNAAGQLSGGVFGGVIDHDCKVLGNRLLLRGPIGMLRIQAAGTAGGRSLSN